VTDAAYASGALGQSETLSNVDANLILRRFSRMLDSFSNESMNVYDLYQDSFAMTPNVATYSTSLLSQGRPVNIDYCFVRLNNVDYPVDLIDSQMYADYAYKITPGIPSGLWVDASYPQNSLSFYPTPYAAFTCFLNCRRNLTMTSTIAYPPGYEKMFVDNLAVDICPSFGLTVPPDLRASAIEAKAVVKRNNWTPLEMDSGLQNRFPTGNDFIYKGF
jgi:hypothetical protein